MGIEFQILDALQKIHTPILDKFMAVITSPLHPIACPFLIIGYLFFILYPVANYIEEKGVPKWVYELLHYEESDEEEEDND